MKVSVIIIILLFTSILHTNGYITIEIEPDDVHQLSDILQMFIENQQIPTRTQYSLRRNIFSLLKSFSRGIVQLISIMMTLVGVNLITMKMESSIMLLNQTEQTTTHMFAHREICKHDFGCTENICWRTCEETNERKAEQKWCFTSSYPNISNFQPCTYSYECSPCWSCSTSCTDGRVF